MWLDLTDTDIDTYPHTIIRYTVHHHSYLTYVSTKGAPIMLEILPIIPSSTSQKIYPLFLLIFILPIILIKFFLAILHAGSSGVNIARQ